MASEPRTPEQFLARRSASVSQQEFHVNELAADLVGAFSPFGPDLEFPLPPSKLRYRHPGPENRPNLAGGY